jgi:hypothetical protein
LKIRTSLFKEKRGLLSNARRRDFEPRKRLTGSRERERERKRLTRWWQLGK